MWADVWWNEHAGLVGLLGLIITSAALVYAVWVTVRSRATKTLDYFVVADDPILSPGIEPEGLEVRWHDKQLRRPRLVTLRLANTGKAEIRADDFDGPAELWFPDARIIYAAVTDHRPGMRNPPQPALYQRPDNGSLYAVMPKVLYNRDDWVDFQFLVDVDAGAHWSSDNTATTIVVIGQTRPPKLVSKTAVDAAVSGTVLDLLSPTGGIFYEIGVTFGRILGEAFRTLFGRPRRRP